MSGIGSATKNNEYGNQEQSKNNKNDNWMFAFLLFSIFFHRVKGKHQKKKVNEPSDMNHIRRLYPARGTKESTQNGYHRSCGMEYLSRMDSSPVSSVGRLYALRGAYQNLIHIGRFMN